MPKVLASQNLNIYGAFYSNCRHLLIRPNNFPLPLRPPKYNNKYIPKNNKYERVEKMWACQSFNPISYHKLTDQNSQSLICLLEQLKGTFTCCDLSGTIRILAYEKHC